MPTTVLGIIKNEKYKGDLLLGKTFTVDPISKRRLDNMGEEDQFGETKIGVKLEMVILKEKNLVGSMLLAVYLNVVSVRVR